RQPLADVRARAHRRAGPLPARLPLQATRADRPPPAARPRAGRGRVPVPDLGQHGPTDPGLPMSGAPPTRPSRLRRGLRVAAESLLAAGLVGALSVIGFGGSAEERPRETASLGAVPYMSSASAPTPVEAALRAARRERGAQAERRRAEEARARRAASPAPPTGRGVPPARSS